MAARSYEVFASAARTATVSSSKFEGAGARTLTVAIDATAIAATPSVVFTIERYNPVGDDWTTVLASAAVTAAGNTVLVVDPAITVVANATASTSVPFTWRVTATHGDADSITYSVYAELS